MFHSLPPSTSSPSPIFRQFHQHTRPSVHDEYLPCDVARQSGGSTPIPSLTGYEPKLVEAEAIEPEDLESRNIELERNLGKDPYQIQERLMRSDILSPKIWMNFEKLVPRCPISSHRCIPIMTQRRALRNRILKLVGTEHPHTSHFLAPACTRFNDAHDMAQEPGVACMLSHVSSSCAHVVLLILLDSPFCSSPHLPFSFS